MTVSVSNSVECANTADITFWISQNIVHEAKVSEMAHLAGDVRACRPFI
jgi:hypothetical protein